MTKCTCTYIQAVQKVKFVMRWRCYNRYLWFEIERNLSPPDAFYGIFYVQKPFASSLAPQTQKPNFAHAYPPHAKSWRHHCLQYISTSFGKSVNNHSVVTEFFESAVCIMFSRYWFTGARVVRKKFPLIFRGRSNCRQTSRRGHASTTSRPPHRTNRWWVSMNNYVKSCNSLCMLFACVAQNKLDALL